MSLWTLTLQQARWFWEEGRAGGCKTREISPDSAACVFRVLRSSKSLLRAHFFPGQPLSKSVQSLLSEMTSRRPPLPSQLSDSFFQVFSLYGTSNKNCQNQFYTKAGRLVTVSVANSFDPKATVPGDVICFLIYEVHARGQGETKAAVCVCVCVCV